MFCSIYGTLGESQPFGTLLAQTPFFQGVQGGRAKRYSSQRQRPVPEPPAPPVHISIMEGHYYDPCEFIFIAGISFLVGWSELKDQPSELPL